VTVEAESGDFRQRRMCTLCTTLASGCSGDSAEALASSEVINGAQRSSMAQSISRSGKVRRSPATAGMAWIMSPMALRRTMRTLIREEARRRNAPGIVSRQRLRFRHHEPRKIEQMNLTIQTLSVRVTMLSALGKCPVDSPGSLVIAKAQAVDAILLSFNGDFADIVTYPPRNYKGIVALQLRDHQEVLQPVLGRSMAYLDKEPEIDHYRGNLLVIEPDRIRSGNSEQHD
jgi:hypothetical protein